MARPPARCGTHGGYLAHRRRGEDACGPCKAAHAETIAAQRVTRGATPRPKGPEHGTRAAYVRELRAWRAGKGPEPCEVCRAANREATQKRRASG